MKIKKMGGHIPKIYPYFFWRFLCIYDTTPAPLFPVELLKHLTFDFIVILKQVVVFYHSFSI